MAETRAATGVAPFPLCTNSFPFIPGRVQVKTGMPSRSTSVMSFTWVTPVRGTRGSTRSSVASGETVRCVSTEYPLTQDDNFMNRNYRTGPDITLFFQDGTCPHSTG